MNAPSKYELHIRSMHGAEKVAGTNGTAVPFCGPSAHHALRHASVLFAPALRDVYNAAATMSPTCDVE